MNKTKIFTIILIVILVITGTVGYLIHSEGTLKRTIEKEFGSFLYGNIDVVDYNAYNYYALRDNSVNYNDIDKNNRLSEIFKGTDFEIIDIDADNGTATILVNFPAANEIIGNENFYTDMLLEYNDYVSKTGDVERDSIGMHMVEASIQQIKKESYEERKITIPISATNSSPLADEKSFVILYNESFFNEIFGEVNNIVDMSDIIETNDAVEANYDYKKIKELPATNKTTRSSVKDPIDMGETAIFDNTDYYYKEENYLLSMNITNVTRGNSALDIIQNADSINDTMLDIGMEYVIVDVEIELEKNNTSSNTVLLDAGDFSMLDGSGHFYSNKIVFGLDEFSPISEGEITSGRICFIADKGTDLYLLFKDYMDNTLCFDI